MKKGTIALILAIVGPLLWLLASAAGYVNLGFAEIPLFVIIGWLVSLCAFILAIVARSQGEKAWGGLILGFLGAIAPFIIVGGCMLLLSQIDINISC